MLKSGWFPPASPHCLIQESLFPDEWAILLSCVLLNRTSRQQVDRVLPELLKQWPDALTMASADPEQLERALTPLGFGKRRTVTTIRFSREFSGGNWKHARELPGIGEYGARAWEIFCRGELGTQPPRDGALVKYWNYLRVREEHSEKI